MSCERLDEGRNYLKYFTHVYRLSSHVLFIPQRHNRIEFCGFHGWIKSSSQANNRAYYDANGNQTVRISYYWDTSANDWVGDSKHEYAYDANGNILSISQYGLQQNASPMIDQLNYSYQQSNSSNKLDLVSDGQVSRQNWVIIKMGAIG